MIEHPCEHTCLNLEGGGYTCVCPDGMEMNADGHSCRGELVMCDTPSHSHALPVPIFPDPTFHFTHRRNQNVFVK